MTFPLLRSTIWWEGRRVLSAFVLRVRSEYFPFCTLFIDSTDGVALPKIIGIFFDSLVLLPHPELSTLDLLVVCRMNRAPHRR